MTFGNRGVRLRPTQTEIMTRNGTNSLYQPQGCNVSCDLARKSDFLGNIKSGSFGACRCHLEASLKCCHITSSDKKVLIESDA